MGAQAMQTKTKVKPISNRVLLKRLEGETTKGGIILPDSAQEKQEIAEVLAVGPGKMTKTGELTPMPIACGDKVLIDKYAGQEITIEDEDYVIVRSDDIIAIVE